MKVPCARNESDRMTRDYKSTVFLPRTDFAMRANLPDREPQTLKRWQEMRVEDARE